MELVNSATKQQAPAEAMVQMGNCMKCLVSTLADNYDPSTPFKFAKLDIKDSFWHLLDNNKDAWNFCYVLPQTQTSTSIDDKLLVVPNCLQMGWCESPPFFCAASETAWDAIEMLLAEATLSQHQFEEIMLQDLEENFALRLQAVAAYTNLIEVFVDDFIAATNNPSPEHLEHFSRVMLHGVHCIFPPPTVMGHTGEDPISKKKWHRGKEHGPP